MPSPSAVNEIWTQDKIDTLKRMWADGKSAGAIAAVLPGNVTRNAVIGKITRLKLPKRTISGSETDRVTRLAAKARSRKGDPKPQAIAAHINDRRKAPTVIPYDVPDTEGTDVTYLVTRDDYRLREHCSYGFGDPKTPDFRFCGKPLHTGHWCEQHAAVVYPGGRP